MIVTPDKKVTVLVIEDDAKIRRLLAVTLDRDGYFVVEAGTGDAGISEAIRCHPGVVLLDLALPDLDGLDVLKRVREWSQVPVLIISEIAHDAVKISALDGGANDYITKPFSPGELLARMRAVLRTAPPAKAETFHSGPLSVDLVTRTVKVGTRIVRLSVTEYSLLRLFVQHAGKVLTHKHILREIWGPGEKIKIGQLRVYMTYLREKLEMNPAKPELLITEPGVGYRLVMRE